MQKIAAVKTSKEALEILEAEFDERGSCHEEADEEDDEVVIDVDSMSEAEHDQEECRESHNAVKHVDDEHDENNEAHCAEPQVDDANANEDGAAIAVVDDKLETRGVAGQPLELENEAATAASIDEFEEEELLKSMPKRA